MRKAVGANVTCPNGDCEQHGRIDAGNVVLHGFSKVTGGRRRRYRCTSCGKTFGATTGTPYKRLLHSMRRFDRVAALCAILSPAPRRHETRHGNSWVVPVTVPLGGPVVRN